MELPPSSVAEGSAGHTAGTLHPSHHDASAPATYSHIAPSQCLSYYAPLQLPQSLPLPLQQPGPRHLPTEPTAPHTPQPVHGASSATASLAAPWDGSGALPAHHPHPSLTYAPPQQGQQSQQPLLYAPWGVAPPADAPPPAAGDAAGDAAVMGMAQGVHAVSLGLHVPLVPAARVAAYYAPLLLLLVAGMALLLGSFFTPTFAAHLDFTRAVADFADPSAYQRGIAGTAGADVANYAFYAPCTLFRQHACDILTQAHASSWMRAITNGMQQPFPRLLALAGIDQPRIRSCTYVAPQPAASANSVAGPAQTMHPNVMPLDPLTRIDDTVPARNTRRALVELESDEPESARAGFMLSCDAGANVTQLLNLTTLYFVELPSPPSGPDEKWRVVSAGDLIASTDPDFREQRYDPSMRTCAEFLIACMAGKEVHHVIVAPASVVYVCGNGSITPPYDEPDSDSALATEEGDTVMVCDTAPYEASSTSGGVLRYTVRGHFTMNLTLYPTYARYPSSTAHAPADLTPSSILFIVTQALLLVALALMVAAAVTVRVQRSTLRRLRAALEADASVALGILHRAQTALFAPPPALPAAAAATHDSASLESSAPPTVPPHSQPPPPPLMMMPPYLAAASGLVPPGVMLVAPPSHAPPALPYGSGHYLPAPHVVGDAAALAAGPGATVYRTPDSVLVAVAPPAQQREADGAGTQDGTPAAAAAAAARHHSSDEADTAAGVVPSPDTLSASASAAAREKRAARGDRVAAVAAEGLDGGGDGGDQELASVHRSDGCAFTPVSRSGSSSEHAAHDAEALPASPPVYYVPWMAPPSVPVSAATDWMFTQSRHVVSRDVLSDTAAASRRSGAGGGAGACVLACLCLLRDCVVARRRTRARHTAARRYQHGSVSDDELDSGSDPDAPGARGAEPESTPGERTIQLFVLRARKSYVRLRRQQVRHMSSLLHYARCVAAVALLLGVATTAVQMANLTPSTATRLQLRDGDVVAGRRRADVGHVSLMSVALLCVLAAVVLHTVVGCKRVW